MRNAVYKKVKTVPKLESGTRNIVIDHRHITLDRSVVFKYLGHLNRFKVCKNDQSHTSKIIAMPIYLKSFINLYLNQKLLVMKVNSDGFKWLV